MYPSTGCTNKSPNPFGFTFAGVRIDSFRFWPVRAISLSKLVPPTAPRPADRDIWHVQRLRINVSVHGLHEQEPEPVRVHVRRCEDRFVQVLARAGDIVVKARPPHCPPPRRSRHLARTTAAHKCIRPRVARTRARTRSG